MKMKKALIGTIAMICASLLTGVHAVPVAAAEYFPSRPVTIVVPYPAGGLVDVRVRELAALLESEFAQQILIDNRAGAMGMIGADRVAKAKPDGYTILAGTVNELALVPAFGVKLPFDMDRDLLPITPYVHGSLILVVPKSLGVGTVAELRARIRSSPGEFNYATLGKGSFLHFLGKQFLLAVAGEATDVPYKGAALYLPDLVSGRLQFSFDSVPTSLTYIESGKLRPLMTTAARRVPLLPDMPTAREVGIPELEIMTWGGFFAPAGTPRPVIDRLNAALSKAINDPQIRARWAAAGAEAVSSSPEAFAEFWKAERAKWRRIVEATGIRAD